jgi:hypothetical protein
MLMKEKEIEGIETVGDLRAATASCPADMAIGDIFRDGLHLVLREDDPEGPYIEVN